MTTKDQVLGALRDRTNEYVSGSQIASHLNISRNAVWKAIEQLRADGYKIHAVTHKGYRLTALSDKLVPDIISRYLKELGVPGTELAPIYFFNELPSVNEKAKEYVADGAAHGTSVIARLSGGKSAKEPEEPEAEADNIYMSIIYHADKLPSFNTRQVIRMCVISVRQAIKKLLDIPCRIRDYDNLYYKGKLISEIYTEGAGVVKNGITKINLIILRISIYGKGLPWNRSLLTAEILKSLVYDKPDTKAVNTAFSRLCE